MSLLCSIGIHKWIGCKCSNCGKTRDQNHDWTKDCKKCAICDKTREQDHDWTKDCEKCVICGATRKDCHRPQGCQCTVCGSEVHEWTAFKKLDPKLPVRSRTCRRCGKENRSMIFDPSDPDDNDAFRRIFLGG